MLQTKQDAGAGSLQGAEMDPPSSQEQNTPSPRAPLSCMGARPGQASRTQAGKEAAAVGCQEGKGERGWGRTCSGGWRGSRGSETELRMGGQPGLGA